MSTPEKRFEITNVMSTCSDSEVEVGTCIFTYHLCTHYVHACIII